jgi:hypothetical protein
MGWLLGWFILGFASAIEFGDLARHAGNQMTQLRAIGTLMGSIISLAMMIRAGVLHAQPKYLGGALVLSAFFFFAGLWWIYYSGAGPQWVTGALALIAYMLASFVICLIAWVVALRRRRAQHALAERQQLERSHHQRLEALRTEAATVRDMRGGDEPSDDQDDFALPKRPKWED